jgi:PDZ domain-containing protein
MIRRVSRRHIFYVALFILVGLIAPLPFVVVEPGTPSDTFGKEKGKQVVEIIGRRSYPTSGKLNLTSIWVTSPDSHLQSFELLRAWVDGERSVQPREVFYPKGENPKKVTAESIADMKNSQLSSKLAALNYLKIPYSEKLIVKGYVGKSPNKSIMKLEDEVTDFNGIQVISGSQLRKLIRNAETGRATIGVIRDRKQLTLPITLSTINSNGSKQNVIGIKISENYQFPFTVKIRLKDVGGPSGGLIFTLAIIDKLLVEDLVRGRNIAGTGTISPSGKVGPIGGIEEKLIGAKRKGATLFLAPSLNCPDIRHIPKGLQVVPVDNLAEAVAALRARDSQTLPICG